MSAVASLLTLMLFLAFATSGLQKVIFNPAISHSADRLGITKRAFQRMGVLEVVGSIGLLVGLAASGASFWAIVNELAAAALFLLTMGAVAFYLRRRDRAKDFTPTLALGLGALLELILRFSL